MKIKYECEADENGYVECLIVDGKEIHRSIHERRGPGASEQISGGDIRNLDEQFEDVLPSILGFNLMQLANGEDE